MTIDNFNEIRAHLTFKSDFDRYIVHIIKRAKDDAGKIYGVNETNRLLKTFYITSLEYFDRKIPVIKDLCESNNARAYILPQVRDNSACLKELLKIVVDNLENPTIKPDHLIRSAYCGYHGSRDKKWIIDLDNDNMTEYRHNINFGGTSCYNKVWTTEDVVSLIKKLLKECGKDDNCLFHVPTKNGTCIVTSPFDLKKAFKECEMMFQGTGKVITGTERNVDDMFDSHVYKEVTGWVIKDGMALLYFNQKEN